MSGNNSLMEHIRAPATLVVTLFSSLQMSRSFGYT